MSQPLWQVAELHDRGGVNAVMVQKDGDPYKFGWLRQTKVKVLMEVIKLWRPLRSRNAWKRLMLFQCYVVHGSLNFVMRRIDYLFSNLWNSTPLLLNRLRFACQLPADAERVSRMSHSSISVWAESEFKKMAPTLTGASDDIRHK